ncbi:MAG: Ig-like domain-containing protein [Microthrixaceae bacterium]|nr:hypothetical protein [Microthrixaceae bacterium]
MVIRSHLNRLCAILAMVPVVLLTAVVGLGLSAIPASAAAIDSSWTLTTSTTNVQKTSSVEVNCTWAVPDDAVSGDTFSLTLPAQLDWRGALTFSLMDPTGTEPVATAVVAPDGRTVEFTLTAYVNGRNNVNGTCRFFTQWTEATTATETKTVYFDAGGVQVPLEVGVVPTCTVNCYIDHTIATKHGWDAGNGQVRWVIATPAPRDLGVDQGGNVVTIHDKATAANGFTFNCEEVIVRRGTTVGGGSGFLQSPYNQTTWRNSTGNFPAGSYCTPTELHLEVTNIAADQMVEVWVLGAPIAGYAGEFFTNEASVQINALEAEVDDARVRNQNASGDGSGDAGSGGGGDSNNGDAGSAGAGSGNTTTTTSTTVPETTTTTTSTTVPETTTTADGLTAPTTAPTGVRGASDAPVDYLGNATRRGGTSVLAFTGSSNTPLAVAAVMLIIGSALVVVARRKVEMEPTS